MATPTTTALNRFHRTTKAVISHKLRPSSRLLWRRWFEVPDERHLADEVRGFIGSLAELLDLPPGALSGDDIGKIGKDIERVVERIEDAIDEPGEKYDKAFAEAIYAIRARYEHLYQAAAGKRTRRKKTSRKKR